MLADQLISDGRREFAEPLGKANWDEFEGQLKSAQKFVLDRSLGDVLGDMPRDHVRTAMPFCRLPFPRLWIEIAQNDRRAFTKLPVAEGLYAPVRVGVLCEQAGDDPAEFWASLVWSFSPADAAKQGGGLGGATINMSAGALYVHTNTPHDYGDRDGARLWEPFTATPLISRYWRDFLTEVGAKSPEMVKFFHRAAENDWQGEIWFWLSALAMLNARNGARSISRTTPPKLAKARAKAGKPPLVDYHELTIRVSPGEASERERASGPKSGPHAHVVRGHFKVRATGIYWWKPFIRGDLDQGFTEKKYRVKA